MESQPAWEDGDPPPVSVSPNEGQNFVHFKGNKLVLLLLLLSPLGLISLLFIVGVSSYGYDEELSLGFDDSIIIKAIDTSQRDLHEKEKYSPRKYKPPDDEWHQDKMLEVKLKEPDEIF